jgi:hypothetical protein
VLPREACACVVVSGPDRFVAAARRDDFPVARPRHGPRVGSVRATNAEGRPAAVGGGRCGQHKNRVGVRNTCRTHTSKGAKDAKKAGNSARHRQSTGIVRKHTKRKKTDCSTTKTCTDETRRPDENFSFVCLSETPRRARTCLLLRRYLSPNQYMCMPVLFTRCASHSVPQFLSLSL